jgi:hypothetical protein
MIDVMNIPTTQPTVVVTYLDLLPQHWPAQADLLHWCQNLGPLPAVLLMAAGLIYLIFGWSAYRVLISINAAVIGGLIGALVGDSMGSQVAGMVLGAFIAAVVTWPAMKYAIALTGGAFGALVGASLWRTAALHPAYVWAGAAIGLIFFTMLSFVIFRTSVILFTSLQGSIMFVAGLLSLSYKYPDIAPQLTHGMIAKPFLLPMVIFIATVIGHVYQHTRHAEQREPAES